MEEMPAAIDLLPDRLSAVVSVVPSSASNSMRTGVSAVRPVNALLGKAKRNPELAL